MDKQIITFSANEQNLVRIGGEYHYSSNKVSYIGAHFDLGANWDGFDSVRAVWFTDRINGISTVLDGEGNCTVPTEVLKKKDRVFVNLVGSIVSNGELTDRLTTYPAVALVVDSKAKVDSTETAPVTPSQFEQFVSIVQDAVANIKDIVSTTLNADYTLTFVYSDGTSYTTPSIRGERGPQGADGADGTDGNGIASAVLNSNYTLTLTFTDGTSYTTPSIRGAQGPKGDPGDVSQAQLDAAVSDLKSEINEISESSPNIGYVTKFSGTKTISDVTISRKDANTITAYGTASGWGKFDVLRGNDTVTAGTPSLPANLSAGKYTLVCNDVFSVLVGADYSSSVAWTSGTTKTFATDVCVWLRVTSSSRNYGTVDNPSEFTFAIYEGEVVTTDIVPSGLIGYDKVARQAIENIESDLSVADVNNIVNEEFDANKLYNIIPPDIEWTPNTAISFANGLAEPDTNKQASGYIEIDPSFGYLCNYVNVRVIGDPNMTDGNKGIFIRYNMAFYDKDKNFVATTSSGSDASKVIPPTAKYVRLTLEKAAYIPYAICFYGNYGTVQNVRYTPYRKQPKQLQFYGCTGFENLKMVMFGDSITHGDLGLSDDGISYVDYANDYLRGNIINCGLGGSRMSQGSPTGVGLGSFASLCENIVSDDATAWDALDAYVESTQQDWAIHVAKLKAMDWSTVQAIGVLYGANDWNNNVPIGTGANDDPLNYDGACAYGLDLLLTKYPHLQVVVFTPFYRKIDNTRDADTPNTKGYTIFDYGKSLQENVRPVFHCPVVDSGNEVGINRYNIYVYTQLVDGTHPRTNIAQYRLGRFFAEAIKRYIQPF